MYPEEKVDVESLRQLLPEEIPLLSIRVLPPLPGSDPLPASLGGLKPPPSGLSDLRSDARTSPFQRPHPRGITFQLVGARLPRGQQPPRHCVFVF